MQGDFLPDVTSDSDVTRRGSVFNTNRSTSVAKIAFPNIKELSSLKTVSEMEKLATYDTMWTTGIFLACVLLIITCDVFEEIARYDPTTGLKTQSWLPCSPYLWASPVSFALLAIIAVAKYGIKSLPSCCYSSASKFYIPLALSYTVPKFVMGETKLNHGVVLWSVLAQGKLIFSAILGVLFLRRRYRSTQWLTMFSVGSIIVVFLTGGAQEPSPVDYSTFINAAGGLFVSSLGAIASEYVLQTDESSFVVQSASYCAVATVVEFTSATVFGNRRTHAGLLFQNWELRTWYVLISNVIKGLVTTYLMKYYDGVWKNIAYSCAFCLTVVSNLVFVEKGTINLVQLITVIIITLNVLKFSLLAKDASKIYELRKELQTIKESYNPV